MRYVKQMPLQSELDDQRLECGIWQSDANVCELQSDVAGACDTSGLYYGTNDERETKFCARHFYRVVVSGDGESSTGWWTANRRLYQ